MAFFIVRQLVIQIIVILTPVPKDVTDVSFKNETDVEQGEITTAQGTTDVGQDKIGMGHGVGSPVWWQHCTHLAGSVRRRDSPAGTLRRVDDEHASIARLPQRCHEVNARTRPVASSVALQHYATRRRL